MSQAVRHASTVAPRRAVIYTRISLDKDGEGVGVERQEDECRALAAREGYEVVAVEPDNSASAVSGKRRPGFEKVLMHLTEGRANTVVVWHLDRLARRLVDLQRVLDLCTGRDAPVPDLVVHPVRGQQVRGDDPTAALTASILTLVASFESSHKGERVAAAARARALAGQLTIRPCYGIHAESGKPVEPAATAVREGFAAFLRSRSVASAHRAMQAADPTGAPAGPSGARKVLRRAAYAGIVTYRGAEHLEVEAKWTHLIDVPTYRRAQAILDQPARLLQPHRDRGARTTLLSGLLRCAACDRPMEAGSSVGPRIGRYATYHCPQCGMSRKARPLDAYIVSLAMTRLGQPDAQATILPRDTHPDAEALSEQWAAAIQRRAELGDLWRAGHLPKSEYERHLVEIQNDLAVLEDRLAAIKTDPDTGNTAPADPAGALVLASLAAMRTVIATLMDVSAHRVRPGRQPLRRESLSVTWRSETAQLPASGHRADARPTEQWWDEVEEATHAFAAVLAEEELAANPGPPLDDDQRRSLWAALTPVANAVEDAEVED